MKELARLLSIRPKARVAIVGSFAPTMEAGFVAEGATVEAFASTEALGQASARFDVAVVEGRTLRIVGAAMAEIARVLPRITAEGCLVIVESLARGADAWMELPVSSPGEVLAAQTGLVDRTPRALADEHVRVLVRPAIAEPDGRKLARLLRLDGARRVGVFGWPLRALPALGRVAPETAFVTEAYPIRPAIDVAIFFASHWGERAGAMLKKRLVHGGTLVFAWEQRVMKAPLVQRVLAPFGFEPSGKPAPLPLMGEDWRVQSFELRIAGEAARPKPERPARPKPKRARPTRREPARLPPAMPPLPSRSEDPLGRKLQALLRPASVSEKLSALRGTAPTSVVGPVTWSNERWPHASGRPLPHLLSVRVDELPFVPEPLSKLAYLSVFAGPDGPVVRSHDSLIGLDKQVAPGRRAAEGRAIRWVGVHDCPSDLAAATKLRVSLSDIEAAREAEALDHDARFIKVGGWPTPVHDVPSESGFVLQLDGLGDGTRTYGYLARGRWRWETASE